MALLRLYNESSPAPAAPAPTSKLRLYDDRTPSATPANAPAAPLGPLNYTPKPAYGASNRTDSSGKPLLTFRNDKLRMSQLLTDRVYPGFDPRIPKKLDRSILTNGRMAPAVSQAIRLELGLEPGEAPDTELDHVIALELSGSNQRSNLSLIPGRAKPGKAFQLNQIMNKLARDTINGNISLLEAHRLAATAKGRKLLEDMTPDEVNAFRRDVRPLPSPVPKPAPSLNADITAKPNFKATAVTSQFDASKIPVNRDAPLPRLVNKAADAATDFTAGFLLDPEDVAKDDPRKGGLRKTTPFDIGITLGLMGPFDELIKGPKAASKLLKGAVNADRLKIADDAKDLVRKTSDEIRPVLEKARGTRLSNAEVIEAAKESEILRAGSSREATLKSEAALLKTRQNLAALAKDGKVTPDFVENLRIVSQEATRRGRELQALSIDANPELATTQARMIRKLVELGNKTEDIVKAADGVDFADARQATAFYRKFVKPTLPELVDEYRYINLLSSPRTHIVNAFSNVLQATVVRPLTRLASGAIDNVASRLTGKEQQFYIRQVPAYYRGAFNAIGEASKNALKALKGETFTLRPDLNDIPTNSKVLRPFQFVPRALEASDQFFRTIIEAAEREALAIKYAKAGKAVNEADLVTEAAKKAEEMVFRKPLDPSNATGQGKLLSHIDKITSQIYQLRKLPGVKWFIPFIQTPMNILKQGIEYSPLGITTLAGNTQKVEQLGKAAVGSLILAGAGSIALQGRTTWSVPTGKKDREAFYAAGMQPYSVKIGDKWVSYSKLGPLAYPIAMAAATRHYSTDDPKAATDTRMEKLQKILTGTAEFFADQSYVQSLGDLLDTVRGDQTALNRLAANVPSQLVPLASLQRWVTQIVDPVYRNAERGLSVSAILENLKKGIPGLSTSVPAYQDSKGNPSRRESPFLNAVSPVQIITENPRERAVFDKRMQEARKRAVKNANDDE